MLFVSPHLWVRVRCYRIHPVCHLPSVGWAVEAFFAGRDLASGTCRTYRQALGPLVEAVGADRPVTSLDADRVAAVFEELWADRAPATWNTRRVAIQAFASWCGDRWLLAEDLLAGVPPRRRRADNTRAVPYEDLEDLWRRRTVPLREKLLWRMLYETAARASEVLVDGQMRRSVERTPWVGVSWRPAVLSGGGLWVVCGGPPPGDSALREGSVT